MNLVSNPNSLIINKLLQLNDTLNNIKKNFCDSEIESNDTEKNDNLIDEINYCIISESTYETYEIINKVKTLITNFLLREILINSPQTDIILLNFKNIKTKLYPYQINNLNWMISIENKKYKDEYAEISKKNIFKGGGLFDDVGMGKTLQIITLLNNNLSNYSSLVKNGKIYCKCTLIIVPNHLCGQWLREIEFHTVKPLSILNLLTKKHYNKYTYFDYIKSDVIIISANYFINCKLDQHKKNNPLYNIKNIFNKDVNLFNIYWHRVVIDEYHEIEDSNLFKKLNYIESDYRWIISATPFKEVMVSNHTNIEVTSLSNIIDFLTFDKNSLNRINIFNNSNYNYIKDHFSKNLQKKNIKDLKLPEIVEENIWLNFNDTERMIYNAYLADPNNDPYDIFLRQICCHPLISEKIRENIGNKVESLNEIHDHIKKMYFSEYDKSVSNYNNTFERIEKLKLDINKMKINNKTNLICYKECTEELDNLENKIHELKNIMDGKEKIVLYYKTFLDLISDIKNVTNEECPICLDQIKENDIGITFCGHIFCFSCINVILNQSKESKCPKCNKKIQMDKIFLINNSVGSDDKNGINKLGTKLSYLINYIKSTPEKFRIIFSQWDYLLKEVGKVLESNNIKNLYCQGNVYQKDKVLKLFNNKEIENNEYRIIMLSSESTVSGSNLNNAEEVILLDPVFGDKQARINTENQAIGRVRRLGNKFKKIKVIRLLIKNSIEEEIFNQNQ